jgi:two-component system, sensor histidine kinase and response regulator
MPNENVTILVIDDKRENIYVLERLLEKPGRKFLAATDGESGLKLALENDVDLVILDVQMPGMDGFEVAQVLKSHKRTKDIPIIFASAEKKERQSIMKGFEEGAMDYLAKPLDPELTRAKVSVLLKVQLQKRELMEKNLSLEKAERQIGELNEHLRRNLEELETMNKDLESFSYSVSHDLRAPLRSVIGYSKILEEDWFEKLDDSGRKALQCVQQNADKMNRLIDDLLQFSKLGRKDVLKTDVDAAMMVQSVLDDMNGSVKHRAAVKIGTLFPAPADYSLIKQVWINLISNALKYSSKKEFPHVNIGSENSGKEIVYFIRDNGAGFDMQYVDKLFSVFQRLHKESEFEGTGVGLALVHRIIKRHGGRVWAEGKPGEGATFYFSLPSSQ